LFCGLAAIPYPLNISSNPNSIKSVVQINQALFNTPKNFINHKIQAKLFNYSNNILLNLTQYFKKYSL